MYIEGVIMTGIIHTNHRSNVPHARLSNYKKTLLSVFDKKKAWNYLTQDRSQTHRARKLLHSY